MPPVIQPQRKIQFAKRDKLDTLLNELEHSDIIVEVDGPTDWLSNIVITPKADLNEIQMNIDMTTANRAIKRTRHVIPTLEELRYKLSGATKFTHLDMNHGYNQFELNPSSRHIMTFYTPRGLRHFRRLNFGTNSAAELFHEEIHRTLADISNAKNIYDDILIPAVTQEEQDATLITVLAVLAVLKSVNSTKKASNSLE